MNLEAVKIVMACVAGLHSKENSEFMKSINYLLPRVFFTFTWNYFFFIVIMTRFKDYT